MIILKIFGIAFLWLFLGFLINLIVYAGRPEYEIGTSGTARFLHIVLNIATVLAIIATIAN